MADLSSTLDQITNNLTDRRSQFRQIERVIRGFIGNRLEHTVVAMAIPMVYAHWEGYVKEICQLYLEHIEHSVRTGYGLAPVLLGYLWSPVLRALVGGTNTQRRADVAKEAVRSLNSSVVFSESEKDISTRSNLDFDQLERVAEQLCIDVTSLSTHRRSLNSLVHIRNNIAHGSIPRQLQFSDLKIRMSSAESLMKDFETQIVDALRSRTFVSRAGMGTQ